MPNLEKNTTKSPAETIQKLPESNSFFAFSAHTNTDDIGKLLNSQGINEISGQRGLRGRKYHAGNCPRRH